MSAAGNEKTIESFESWKTRLESDSPMRVELTAQLLLRARRYAKVAGLRSDDVLEDLIQRQLLKALEGKFDACVEAAHLLNAMTVSLHRDLVSLLRARQRERPLGNISSDLTRNVPADSSPSGGVSKEARRKDRDRATAEIFRRVRCFYTDREWTAFVLHKVEGRSQAATALAINEQRRHGVEVMKEAQVGQLCRGILEQLRTEFQHLGFEVEDWNAPSAGHVSAVARKA